MLLRKFAFILLPLLPCGKFLKYTLETFYLFNENSILVRLFFHCYFEFSITPLNFSKISPETSYLFDSLTEVVLEVLDGPLNHFIHCLVVVRDGHQIILLNSWDIVINRHKFLQVVIAVLVFILNKRFKNVFVISSREKIG